MIHVPRFQAPRLQEGVLAETCPADAEAPKDQQPGSGSDTRCCVVCGLSLTGHRADARHCSGACRAEAARLRAILSLAPGQRYASIAERLAARHKRTQED